MDIAVLTRIKKDNTVWFSGANNPLFYIRDEELIKIRGSRFAIGGDYYVKGKEKNFELHKIELRKDDKFYIFSDGFHDQFGGKDNKKYMIGPFKRLISKHAHLPMAEQKEAIETEFLDWKSETEQTDDVLIIGIRY
jgi:serine phosphatase RsbU (regulator of sigma subunit)